jgi:hypothetical protein
MTVQKKTRASWFKSKALAINAEHANIVEKLRRGLDHAIKAGSLLIEVKEHIEHGAFEPWVKRYCKFSIRTGQLYMQIARNKEKVKNATIADLTLHEAVARIAGEPIDSIALSPVNIVVKHQPATTDTQEFVAVKYQLESNTSPVPIRVIATAEPDLDDAGDHPAGDDHSQATQVIEDNFRLLNQTKELLLSGLLKLPQCDRTDHVDQLVFRLREIADELRMIPAVTIP